MNAGTSRTTWTTEDFAAALTDMALQIAAQNGVTTDSVEVELELWHALAAALQGQEPSCGVVGEATDAAYRTLLSHHPQGAFLDLELGLWRAFRNRWPGRSALAAPVAC
jgi:hypothetical protein